MSRRRIVAMVLASALALGISGRAMADCAVPGVYSIISAPDNTVAVCLPYYRGECPDAGDVLREDIDTGEVVKLHRDCGSYDVSGHPTSCYVDECVPQGEYRYGYEVPLTCESACYADYYGRQSVADPVDGCVRTLGTTPPEPYPDPPPWDGRGQEACRYDPPFEPEPPGPSDAGTDPPGSDIDIPDEGQDGPVGCGCSIPAGRPHAVLLLHGLALVLGLLLFYLRRK